MAALEVRLKYTAETIDTFVWQQHGKQSVSLEIDVFEVHAVIRTKHVDHMKFSFSVQHKHVLFL